MTVGAVSELTGVTVRTLHHYDEIGLLRPTERSEAGYRLYGERDLDRLQQILAYRALGLSLESIRELLESGGEDVEHLERQHRMLTAQIERLGAVVDLIEIEMEARKMGINLTPKERFEVFGDFDPTEHAEEAEARWGESEAWRQSQRRAAGYSKADWQRIKDEMEEIEAGFAAAMAEGEAVEGPAVRDLVERHRDHITRNFYDCSPAMQLSLARMYVSDARFAEHYERRAPGLARYICAAVEAANASG